MPRRRKAIWIGLILLVLAGGIGGYCWYWQSHAIDRKVRQLVYEAAGYPDTNFEKFLKQYKLGFLLKQKPVPREYDVIEKELKEIGSSATPELICLTNDEKRSVRYAAIITLSLCGDHMSVEPLIQALEDTANYYDNWLIAPTLKNTSKYYGNGQNPLSEEGYEVELLHYVIEGLGRLGDARAVDPLIKIMQNHKYIGGFRTDAANALGDIKDRRAVDPMVRLLLEEKDNPGVDRAAAKALGKLGDSVAVEPLIKVLQSDNANHEYICSTVAEALGKLGDASAIGPLEKVVKEEKGKFYDPWWDEKVFIQAIAKIKSAASRPAGGM